MSHDRDLIESIKLRFARKSAAQLQEIVRTNDRERWSEEALLAADEVLQERAAGCASEPAVGEEDAPPRYHYEPGEVAAGLLAGLLTGHVIIPYYEIVDSDRPIPFGPSMAWLALETTDTQRVAAALGLQQPRAVTWAEGIEGAYRSSVFVTPPLADWTMALGTCLFPTGRVETFVKPLLERLSQDFGEVQYFGSYQDVKMHMWARASAGRLVRGYGWLGDKAVAGWVGDKDKGLTFWDEGPPTREERDLGFQFVGGSKPGRSQDPQLPDEAGVMQLASLWSIDPTSLDQEFQEPLPGLLGNMPPRAGGSAKVK
jgi:hypothetical protein